MSTQTTVQSYGSRVAGAFKGMGVGCLLVVIGVVGLFWNEGRTIKETRKLDEGEKVVVDVDAATVEAGNDGKLIHISGDVVSSDIVSDPEFGVALNALKLTRKVEMYQWEEQTTTETRRLSGGREETTTTTSYSKVWSEDLIDSTQFQDSGYDNPTAMPYQGEVFTAQTALLGAFQLSQDQKESLGPENSLDPQTIPANEGVETAPQSAPVEETNNEPTSSDAYYRSAPNDVFAQDITIDSSTASSDLTISTNADSTPPEAQTAAPAEPVDAAAKPYKPYGGGYYVGTPDNPQIGDVKITFSYVATPCPTSFVAQQHGNTLIPYETKNGKLLLQSEGIQSAEAMFEAAHKANKMFAWIIRLVGFFVILFGFKAIMQPLSVIADFVPFAGKIVGFGTGLVAWSLTIFLALTTIAVGWIYYRPWLGIPLLIVAVVALVYPFVRGKKKDNGDEAVSPV